VAQNKGKASVGCGNGNILAFLFEIPCVHVLARDGGKGGRLLLSMDRRRGCLSFWLLSFDVVHTRHMAASKEVPGSIAVDK